MESERQHIIELAQAGDESALAQLMESVWQPVYRYMRGLGVPEADLADFVQEALIRAMTKLHLYQPQKSDFHTWVCTISKNIYLDQLRKRKHEVSLDEIDEPAVMAPLRDTDLRAQLQLLNPEVRLIILLHHVHGHTHKSISRLLRIPEGTVKSKAFYGLAKLRKGLMCHDG